MGTAKALGMVTWFMVGKRVGPCTVGQGRMVNAAKRWELELRYAAFGGTFGYFLKAKRDPKFH